MISKLFKQQKRSKPDLSNLLDRLTWILEHTNDNNKHDMLVSLCIELTINLPLYERKVVEKIIERCK